jgi:Protein of unknown function (DUF2950)
MKRSGQCFHHLAALGLAGLVAISGCCAAHHANETAAATSTMSDAGATTAPTEDENGVIHFSQETPGLLQPGQSVFNSPEEAAAVFKDAVAAKDRRTLISLFGNEGNALIFAGDRVQENNDLQAASDRMSQYLRVERTSDTQAVVHEGKENWPFPIPIVKSDQGWFFDVVAGRDELLNRQIGEDELNAIQVCRAYVAAQKEYASKPRTPDGVIQYAQHVMSQPGTHDGLYWEPAAGEELSPLGPLVAEARLEGYPATQSINGKPHPFHGYIFHILKAQGPDAPGGEMNYVVDGKMTKGFAMVARPSAYGASGIMTFIVAQDGKVFQKNLGENTRDTVNAMTEYNPDGSWAEVKD